jgi:hypothetical protein
MYPHATEDVQSQAGLQLMYVMPQHRLLVQLDPPPRAR